MNIATWNRRDTAVFIFAVLGLLITTAGSPIDADTCRQEDESAAADDNDSSKSAAAAAQDSKVGISFGNEVQYKWKVGFKIATAGGSFKNVMVTIPVPVEWPEQNVRLLEENVPIEMGDFDYRELDDNVKQIIAKIDSIPARKLVEFDLTFLVTVREIVAPPDPSVFQKPSPVPKNIRHYLGVGPGITYRNGKIRSQVKKLVKTSESAWHQTEAIFDWVRDNIEYRDGEKQDTLTTFRQRAGNAEDLVGLFVAMCRANKVPARMVWIEGHQYAEFYLWDQEKNGHWIPCNVAGLREFGSYSNPRIIQQKGDNIKVPENKERLKFVPEFITGKGKARPKVLFVRELLSTD